MPYRDTHIAFVTLGCAKNEVDSDRMKASLRAASFSLSSDIDEADLVVVNTCAFLTSAVEEGLDVIFDLVEDIDERGAQTKVLVAGCMPARYGKELADELVEVAGFVSLQQEADIVDAVCMALGLQTPLPGCASGEPRLRCDTGPYAYVKISDGCDRFCSYCMIPHIRGRYHSYPFDAIHAEVAELVAAGTREIVFIAQDTGLWGRDLHEPSTTARLLEVLAGEFTHTWFRLLYVQPNGITDELLDCMATHDNVCSYIDMPLQHSDATLLRRMNREGSAEEFLATLERIRTRVPDVSLRTTFMAGFPSETEQQHEALCAFAEQARFDFAGVFAYSREEGSRAAEMDGQLSEECKLQRAQHLLDVCDVVGYDRARRHIATTCSVLVEGFERTDAGLEALCRSQAQAPEVDGQVHVPVDEDAPPRIGSFLDVRITDTFCHELEGEVV